MIRKRLNTPSNGLLRSEKAMPWLRAGNAAFAIAKARRRMSLMKLTKMVFSSIKWKAVDDCLPVTGELDLGLAS